VNEDSLVAVVSPDAWYSPDFSVSAQWASGHRLCPDPGNWVQVETLGDYQDGYDWQRTNEAFSVIVPWTPQAFGRDSTTMSVLAL
jgi:hypothetical protein